MSNCCEGCTDDWCCVCEDDVGSCPPDTEGILAELEELRKEQDD